MTGWHASMPKIRLLHFWTFATSFWMETARCGRNYSMTHQSSSSTGKKPAPAPQHGRAAPHGGSHSANPGTADEKAFQTGITGHFPVLPSGMRHEPVMQLVCHKAFVCSWNKENLSSAVRKNLHGHGTIDSPGMTKRLP